MAGNILTGAEILCHATAVDIAGRGVLLRGPSGSGKSDLALRLMDRGGCFVSDDQTLLKRRKRGVFASAPLSIRGYLEIRGLGITSVPVTGGTFVSLIVDLVALEDVPRLPEYVVETLLGEKIPTLKLNAFEVSTPIKIELAVGDVSRIGNLGKMGAVEGNGKHEKG